MGEGGKKTDFLKIGKEYYLFLCSVWLYLLRFIKVPSYGVYNIDRSVEHMPRLIVRIMEL